MAAILEEFIAAYVSRFGTCRAGGSTVGKTGKIPLLSATPPFGLVLPICQGSLCGGLDASFRLMHTRGICFCGNGAFGSQMRRFVFCRCVLMSAVTKCCGAIFLQQPSKSVRLLRRLHSGPMGRWDE